MLKVGFKLLTDINKAMNAEAERTRKATSTALKREGFLLSAELRKNIKAGHSGGQKFTKLSFMSRRTGGKFPARRPFTKLWSTRQAAGPSKGTLPIRYNPVLGSDGMRVDVGLVDTRQEQISKSWIRIFKRQQEGYTQTVTERQRRYLAAIGSTMPKGTKQRKYFFLRAATTTLKTPARPIIEPFYSQWNMLSSRRIEENIHKKLRGEKI